MTSDARKWIAFVAPMAVFLLLLAMSSALKRAGGAFWLSSAEYWIYPLQTVVCAALVARYWRDYAFGPLRSHALVWTVAIAVFLVWISPQAFLGLSPRRIGFNPEPLQAQPAIYWASLMLRLLRLIVIVPLIEEIFWRGFLLRYLIDDRFWRVPLGAFSWLSFGVVTVAFALSHATADWPAALICGAAYNFIAYRTKSLTSCVVAHALTNALLGIWIMHTRQWGFW
ncbi:MAG: CAAX prenyl protease-related protein [Chthoniobacterales bacterium]